MTELLAKLDQIFYRHPDAMLDIVEVKRRRAGLRIYCRLSRKGGVVDDLHERVEEAIQEVELRSGAKDRRTEEGQRRSVRKSGRHAVDRDTVGGSTSSQGR